MKEKTLQISGMTCSACASSVEKGLSQLEGVEYTNVNLAMEQATVRYNPELTNVNNFKNKVEDLGYGVVEQTKEFDVVGMTCSACAASIEKGLNNLDGVASANINFALETVSVAYDDKQIQPKDMITAVRDMGYELILKQSS